MKKPDSSSMLRTYWGEPDQTYAVSSVNYYDTPRYVVDVLGEPCQRHTDVFPSAEIIDTL